MCKYCKFKDHKAEPFTEDYDYLTGYIEENIRLDKTVYNLIVDIFKDKSYFEINYCPFCGRKLSE